MDGMETLQKSASLLLEKAQNATVAELASAVEHAAGALRLSMDFEKSQAELRNLALEESKLRYENNSAQRREHSERLKEYVALITPGVAIVTLAATLLVQSLQFRQSEKDKAEAVEDGLWADSVKTISQDTKLSPSVVALNPFLKSARYRERARNLAVQLLANGTDDVRFADLFGAAFVPVNWDNLDEVLKLDKALNARETPLLDKTWNSKTETNDYSKVSIEEKKIMDYADNALKKICSQSASVLRTSRPSGQRLDLSTGRFYDCDWSGADLSGANIERIVMSHVDLKDADLSDITEFEGAYFFEVAWWDARKISPKLLEYLEKDEDSKYREGAKYGHKDELFTPQQYTAAVHRLKQLAP